MLGMQRNTTVTKPSREVQAIIMSRAIAIWGTEKKVDNRSHPFALHLLALIFKSVIAEGVNSELQMCYSRKLGCSKSECIKFVHSRGAFLLGCSSEVLNRCRDLGPFCRRCRSISRTTSRKRFRLWLRMHLSCTSPSHSRSILKILYDLCRKALSEPFHTPCVAFDATCPARAKARRDTQQLLASTEVELRRGHGTRWQTCLELRGSSTGIDHQGRSRFVQAVIQRFQEVPHGLQGISVEARSHLFP
jgi:hypothetical protein